MDYEDPNLDAELKELQTYDTNFNDYDYDPYENSSMNTGAAAFLFVVYAAVIAVTVASMWRIFTKAGKPGWAAIVPIYNIYVMLQIVGRPTWWILLFLIPFVNIVVSLITAMDLAKAFGKSQAFGIVALWLFGIVGYPMLAFSNAKYTKPPTAA